MDIWFWVNDWWSWTGIYLGGGLYTLRSFLRPGWRYDSYTKELSWRYPYDDGGIGVTFGVLCWPIGLPFTWAIANQNGIPSKIAVGRPSKELRNQVKEDNAQKELERVNKILRDEGIEV